jgi:hypothetical protein
MRGLLARHLLLVILFGLTLMFAQTAEYLRIKNILHINYQTTFVKLT